ncbi:MAG: oxidoreductase [Frankiales bacterium]|nr:oxidoreductase [Frankiales bacterium]
MSTDTHRGSKRAAARRRIEDKRAAEEVARSRAARRRRNLLGGVAAAVVLVLAVVTVFLVQSSRTATTANAPVPANTTNGMIVVGNAGAPVTMDLYEDFQCPNCKAFEAQSGSTMAQLVAAGTVQLHYHGMAFLDTQANGGYSTRALNAAAVVVATAGPDAFQKFHDLLYANQPPEGGSGLTDSQLIAYAVQAGANRTAVSNPISDLRYGDWVKKVTSQASQAGVTGTPTVLVAGKALTDLSPAGVTAAVQAAGGH